MSLKSTFERTLAGVEAHAERHGRAESTVVKLQHGAAFRVRLEGQRITVTLMREHKPVGFPTEEATFCKHFGIPAAARREDLGRQDGWHRVSYSWERTPPAEVEAVEQGTLF